MLGWNPVKRNRLLRQSKEIASGLVGERLGTEQLTAAQVDP